MGSIIGHRVDKNGVGALRAQRHIPSKNLAMYSPGPSLHLHGRRYTDQKSRWNGGRFRGTPYDGLYREAPLESGILFRLQVYERVGISLVEVYKG